MQSERLRGLIAAAYTPLTEDGHVNTAAVAPLVEHLLSSGITGLYVCGSTGEGMSLSSDERKEVAEAFTKTTAGRVPVIVQVGHNSLVEARSLAEHAQHIGADMVSATCPSYFKVNGVQGLIASMAQVAAGAPNLPFYYYHIPALTGSTIDVVQFLRQAPNAIPTLAGLKYTDTKLFEFQECLELSDGQYDVVWGCDEMLLGAIATGAHAAIGSTYNVAAPLYQRIISAFEAGNTQESRRLQSLSIQMIRTMNQYPFHSAMKAVLELRGLAVGGCRLPQQSMSGEEKALLKSQLETIGFFDWSET
ncbi:MAG TPA: N-acetylneuraminate lyase [Planctomycetaceae bacterium]|nr:N-acetylneuraminate lyase [Planctomycetaceae bacterium]